MHELPALVTIDFETYYDKEYSLSKLTTEEYVRSPLFEVIGVGIVYGNVRLWLEEADFRQFISECDFSNTSILCHNTLFDGAIMAWHYSINPRMWLDTLSMARAINNQEKSNSLKMLAIQFGLGEKGEEVIYALGKHRSDFTIAEWAQYGKYCINDCTLTYDLFKTLYMYFGKPFPTSELQLIDAVLRMYTEPRLVLNQQLLSEAYWEDVNALQEILARLNITEKDLASNPKFAAILEQVGIDPPLKRSKTSGEFIYAFAKTDVGFQSLINSDNDVVSTLCEARLRTKSTLMRTRSQRLYDISTRGALPMPYAYYGAHTGRIQAARQQAINMQNLKRGSKLRGAILAPPGMVLCVTDLKQIEVRVLATLAKFDALLATLAQDDPYAIYGATMFSTPGMTKETHPALRQAAKSALLGCFGADTKVLTPRGWIPIVSVQATDLVWDGTAWVKHKGLIQQGMRETLTAHGLSATAKHAILTEHGWQEWHAALTNHSLFQSALSLVNLPYFAGSVLHTKGSGKIRACINRLFAVRAVGKDLYAEQTCAADEQQDATHVPKRRQQKRVWSALGMKLYARIKNIDLDFKIELVQLLCGALTQKVQCTRTMAVGGLQYIHNGLQTGSSFLNTYSPCQAGMYRRCKLIVSTIAKGTYQATCAFAREVQTRKINVKLQRGKLKSSNSELRILKQKMLTYDLAYCGPNNSYTILTDAGPIIVHNCGYGLGGFAFTGQLLAGFMGAPPVRYEVNFAVQMGYDVFDIQEFAQAEELREKILAIPHACTDNELLVHSFVAHKIIDKYRATSQPVVTLWSKCNNIIKFMRNISAGITFLNLLPIGLESLWLPNGMRLNYPSLHLQEKEGKSNWVYGKMFTKLYGGKLTENIVQALARIIMTDAMLRIRKELPVVLTSHDELGVLAPEQDAEAAMAWINEQMIVTPEWMPDIALAVDGGYGTVYGDIK